MDPVKRQSQSRRSGRRFGKVACAVTVGLAAIGGVVWAQEHAGPQQPWSKWKVHDMSRPAPPVVTPGTPSTQEQPGKPPSDAIVLFDGKSLDQWTKQGSEDAAPWKVENGYMVAEGAGIATKEQFGDVQLHAEWMEPPAQGDSQGRGNSGIFFMGRFETQVLDNFKNPTYPDGQCGAIYGQYPPQVNACLPPGEWQTYDIIFHRPRFKEGKLEEPAYITVIQNGVVVQDHHRIEGPTGHMIVAHYDKPIPEKGPIALQFHGNPIKYRNIWVRPLEALEHQQDTGEVAERTGAAEK
jgi:hypothetical protein